MTAALKKFCKDNKLKCSIRRRSARYYATVSRNENTKESWPNTYSQVLNHGTQTQSWSVGGYGWLEVYRVAVSKFYKDAVMTSGGPDSATFLLGDIVAILSGEESA
jgi:hypothetical protein